MVKINNSEAYYFHNDREFEVNVVYHDYKYGKKATLYPVFMRGLLQIKLDAPILHAIEVANNFVEENIPVIRKKLKKEQDYSQTKL